jgi:hypothetical protein
MCRQVQAAARVPHRQFEPHAAGHAAVWNLPTTVVVAALVVRPVLAVAHWVWATVLGGSAKKAAARSATAAGARIARFVRQPCFGCASPA